MVSPHAKQVPSSQLGSRGLASATSPAPSCAESELAASDTGSSAPLRAPGFSLPPHAHSAHAASATSRRRRVSFTSRARELQALVESLEGGFDTAAIFVSESADSGAVQSIA